MLKSTVTVGIWMAMTICLGCQKQASQDLQIDEVLPPAAIKARPPPGLGTNHTEPNGDYAWFQGFKYEGDYDTLLAELSVKLEPLGYHLEDHRNYADTYGETRVSNTKVLRIYRGVYRSVGVYCFSTLPGWNSAYANYGITFRLR
jgi:hypothetical protein